MFGFRKRQRAASVEEFLKSETATAPQRAAGPGPVTARLTRFVLPVVALVVVVVCVAQVWRLRAQVVALENENVRKAAEITALKQRGDGLNSELDKSFKQIDVLKSDTARLEKELETEKFLRAKEAQAAAKKTVEKKKPQKRRT